LRVIKLVLTLLLGLAVLLFGVLFTIRNTSMVSIDLIWIELPQASLSIWLVGFFVAGSLFGVLMTSTRSLLLSARLGQMNRKQRKIEAQLQQLQQTQ